MAAQEPRTQNHGPRPRRTRRRQQSELRQLSEDWGQSLLSTDEALGSLLAYLAR